MSSNGKSKQGERTFVIGVGMTKFDKPGTKEGDYPDWAKEAGEAALADAGIPYDDVEEAEATFGYTYVHLERGQPLRCRTTAPGADLNAFQPCAVSELDAKLGPTVEPELEPGPGLEPEPEPELVTAAS